MVKFEMDMKFENCLAIAQSLLRDPSYELCDSIIQYDRLQELLKPLNFHQTTDVGDELDCGECSVCLEPFSGRADVVTTKCKHSFHPCCLVEALTAAAPDASCPLCRCGLKELRPSGLDGDILRFFATFRFNVDKVDNCHEKLIKSLECKIATLPSHTKPSCVERIITRCSGVRSSKTETTDAIWRTLLALELCTSINILGLHTILTQLSQQCGPAASAALGDVLRKRRFHREFVTAMMPTRLDALRTQLAAAAPPPPQRNDTLTQLLTNLRSNLQRPAAAAADGVPPPAAALPHTPPATPAPAAAVIRAVAVPPPVEICPCVQSKLEAMALRAGRRASSESSGAVPAAESAVAAALGRDSPREDLTASYEDLGLAL